MSEDKECDIISLADSFLIPFIYLLTCPTMHIVYSGNFLRVDVELATSVKKHPMKSVIFLYGGNSITLN